MRSKKINFEALREIPIFDVAQHLGMELVRVGGGVWGTKAPEGGVTSLRIFERSNRWKRFSGKDDGTGVSEGSVIDFVMWHNRCDLKEAAEFLRKFV